VTVRIVSLVQKQSSASRLLKLSVLPCSNWESYRGENDQPDSCRGLGQLRVEDWKEAGPCRFLETRLHAGARSRPRHVQYTWGARRRVRAESCRLPP